MDRRNIERVPGRLRVQFEANDIKGIAITADISPDGCLLHASALLEPGTRVRGRIFVQGKVPVDFDGEVRWSRHVEWALGQQYPNSVGVSFSTPPSETYYQELQSRAEAVQ